jgi:hypothetical protein
MDRAFDIGISDLVLCFQGCKENEILKVSFGIVQILR